MSRKPVAQIRINILEDDNPSLAGVKFALVSWVDNGGKSTLVHHNVELRPTGGADHVARIVRSLLREKGIK